MIQTFYLAICQRCTPILPMPFVDPAEWNEWAEAHLNGTDHEVEMQVEQRIDFKDVIRVRPQPEAPL